MKGAVMKRRVSVVAVGSLMLCLIAQSVVAATWEAGFKGGIALPKLNGDTGISASFTDGVDNFDVTGDVKDSRTAFAGGGFATAKVNEQFSVRIEALYAQKGGKGPLDVFVNGFFAGTADVSIQLSYIEIPVLFVGSFPAGAKTKIDLFAGPAVGFKTGADLKIEAQGVSDKTDFSDQVKSTDFGMTIGAGTRLPASEKVGIVIDGRYSFGLSSIAEDSGVSIKNQGFVFMAGLSFPLGGGGGS